VQPVFCRFFKIPKVQQLATEPGKKIEQPQPLVRLQLVVFGPVSVFFPVAAT
jgi:hypothetical protein